MVKAKWSGAFPCLCSGEWTLEVDGKDVSNLIPDDLRRNEMNTYATYYHVSLGEDYMEEYSDYEDGLMCDEWIEENAYWLNMITMDIQTQQDIYYAINANDWRHCSCGGCI